LRRDFHRFLRENGLLSSAGLKILPAVHLYNCFATFAGAPTSGPIRRLLN
jgi:hypothetical protein